MQGVFGATPATGSRYFFDCLYDQETVVAVKKVVDIYARMCPQEAACTITPDSFWYGTRTVLSLALKEGARRGLRVSKEMERFLCVIYGSLFEGVTLTLPFSCYLLLLEDVFTLLPVCGSASPRVYTDFPKMKKPMLYLEYLMRLGQKRLEKDPQEERSVVSQVRPQKAKKRALKAACTAQKNKIKKVRFGANVTKRKKVSFAADVLVETPKSKAKKTPVRAYKRKGSGILKNLLTCDTMPQAQCGK